jgi:coiled-coil domain-containing protein 63/114
MDMYTRNVEVIQHAFDQIEKATGISSVEEIVTTFIKAEEQNYSLFNYVNSLNSDIDMIDEQNKKIGDEIQHHLKLQGMSDVEKLQAKDNLAKEIQDYAASNEDKANQISHIES